MHVLRPALTDEAGRCYGIIEEAKAFQREQGFTQWTEDYPSQETVAEDIRDGKGFVITADGEIAGYMCIDFTGEPAYDRIDGSWNSDEPYAVVHRMAFDRKFIGCGMSSITFSLIDDFCMSRGVSYIRVDTDPENHRMQHVLKNNGFTECGVVVFQGSGKLAYDKILSN